MRKSVLAEIMAARSAKTPVVLITHIPTGAQTLVTQAAILTRDGDLDEGWPDDQELLAAADQALVQDKSRRYPDAAGDLFVQAFNPPKRLILVGAVHIAQKLAPMAVLAEFDVTIVDPRGAFATADRFPGVALATDWPDEALERLDIDRRTAVVTLTHDPKLDDPALAVALKSDAFYIGSLGSRRTHKSRLERLAQEGFGAADVARIHGPVGLALGAQSPSEIALSILAQITQVLHGAGQKETAS
ncbi:MAG: XdhC family protein [Alphaproteobacteria bacterium]|nr:XdhC family protein [Alphaproteobacteria bacterium]